MLALPVAPGRRHLPRRLKDDAGEEPPVKVAVRVDYQQIGSHGSGQAALHSKGFW